MHNSLKAYENTVKDVADTYLKSLFSRLPFDAKLLSLYVTINIENNHLSYGVTRKAGNLYSIVLGLNPKYGTVYNTFIICHEFAHLLFAKHYDSIGIVGASSDGSRPFTNIIRITEDGTLIGKEFEEQCADVVGLFILHKMGISVDSTLENDLKKTEARRFFAETFINSFGKPIAELEHLDDYFYDENYNVKPSNYFWYFVTNYALSELIAMYNARTFSNAFFDVIALIEQTPDIHISISEFMEKLKVS
jgi:hypothetical protein